MSDKFVNYQADILFLLIGSNPLPNYVAACLLSRPQATILLLASKATSEIADRLVRKLRKEMADATFQIATIPEADGPAIAHKVDELARPFSQSSAGRKIGLNYTGGTKPMSAYSFHSLSRLFPSAIFSYLDPRSLRMVIDPAGGTVQQIPVGDAVRLTLDDIAELHGYRVKERRNEPRNLAFAQAIAQVHLAEDGMKQWRDWLQSWKEGAKLPTLDDYPACGPALEAFAAVCGGIPTEVGVAQAIGFQRLDQCGKYLIGEWLEDYTLNEVTKVAGDANLRDYAAQLKFESVRPESELDVITTLGYQLFGISCRTAPTKKFAKEHLLEVFVRARQLGGDEARIAEVTLCNNEDVRLLESEVSSEWDAAGKIRVFGRSHILDLSTHLLRWFREASQEEV